ncbi:MAG TPA: histidine kinase [Chitinophaga sp.]|uniref:sensor histidine kinase n=1 Tax=Chitinophaga sp. TaxID=1869181 RepID=UPI002DBCABD4|nr:histidine kinase [Chitinophaga sp.]HEU4555004.1 histidine kinase [Chitinophaga sp.]
MNFSVHPFYRLFRSKTIPYHVLGWTLFILYELSAIPLRHIPKDRGVYFDYVFPYMINILLFYFHAHVTLDSSFRPNRNAYALFFLLILTELALYLGLMILLDSLSRDTSMNIFTQLVKGNPTPLLLQLWRGIYFIGFSSAYWFALRSMASERKVLQLEKDKMQYQIDRNNLEKDYIEMQNAYLQSQVNPHLLFNTLNFVYNNVQQASQEASEAIILLSELMNFSLREPEADGKVDLEKEVEQIKNIIKINQIRFNNRLYIDVEFNGDFSEARIIPMGLLPFIENVFKHANLTDKDYPGKITVNYNCESVELVTLNKKKNRSKAVSHGIGLANIRKRLDNIYKNNYTLTINNGEQDFYVHLIIKLKPETDD